MGRFRIIPLFQAGSLNSTPPENMNMNLRKLFAFARAGVLAASLTTYSLAKEEKAAVGSIRPAGKIRPADLPSMAKVSFDTAMKAALAAAPGHIIKAEPEVDDGYLIYSFEIVGADKSITEAGIDVGKGNAFGTNQEAAWERQGKG